ncbi:MAG TPA: fused MFS/spermidine synthase [candidate division Zixibacteria bacterium]|nr:fused MFS/spermidine synthase [candidate division Zixibacteria bacterium]
MVHLLLNVVVFVSGGVLMGLEIVGSRVLAPYFGSSIFVWGSLISVVMAALSLGYYWGGWLSAREPSYGKLLVLLLIPGVLIFFLPFVYPTVNEWIAGIDFGTRLNPLIACSIYFLLPGVFLGTISPYVIRLAATRLATVGSTAGTLYAVSTCGSIFGTLLTAFYLIPVMGVSNIIHSLGLTLIALSFVVVPLVRLRSPALGRAVAALSVIGSVLASWPLPTWARVRTILEKDTFYHRIRVEEDDEARYLYFDRTLQSAMNLNDPTALRLTYSRYTSLAFVFRPDARKMLLIGLGGGSIPKKVQKEFPDLEIDAVEIDPEVIRIARSHFNVREGKNLRIHAQDGRLFLARTQNLYDIILIDAYYSDAMPFHLATREFFELAQKKLTPNGIVVTNLISAVTGPSGRIARAFVKTQRRVFPQTYIFAARRPDNVSIETVQNVIVVATKDKRRLDIREILRRASALDRGLFPDRISDIGVAYYDGALPDHDVPVLTDDYAPTDNLLHP